MLPIRIGKELTLRVRADKWLTFWLCIAASRVCDFFSDYHGALLREAAWRALGLEVVEESDDTQTS
jgi:hypothetical protein